MAHRPGTQAEPAGPILSDHSHSFYDMKITSETMTFTEAGSHLPVPWAVHDAVHALLGDESIQQQIVLAAGRVDEGRVDDESQVFILTKTAFLRVTYRGEDRDGDLAASRYPLHLLSEVRVDALHSLSNSDIEWFADYSFQLGSRDFALPSFGQCRNAAVREEVEEFAKALIRSMS